MLRTAIEDSTTRLLVDESQTTSSTALIDPTSQQFSLGDAEQLLEQETTFWQALKENWKEGLPIVISTAAVQGSSFWGMKLLAEYGGDYNAAEQSINAIYYLMYYAATMPFLATNQFISSKFHNAEEKGEIINDVIASGMNVAIISVSTILALSSSRSVLQKMEQPESVIAIAGDYFDFYRYAVLPAIASGAISQALTGLEDTIPLGVINTLSAAACVIAQYAFIKGEMGQSPGYASGLAKAATVQAVTSATFLLAYFMAKMYLHPEWRNKPSIKKIFKSFGGQSLFGLVIDLIVSAETGALFLITGLIGKHIGKKGLADFNIITQYFSIGVPLQLAIRQATTGIIGRLKSKRDSLAKRVRDSSYTMMNEALDKINVRCANRAVYAGILNCSAVSTAQFVFSVSATKLIVEAFEKDASSDDVASMRALFIVYSLVQAFDAVRNTYGAGLAANKNVLIPFLISVILILGATVGFSALDLALDGGLLDVFGINGAAIGVAVASLGTYWHRKESNALRLTYNEQVQAPDSKEATQRSVTPTDSAHPRWGRRDNFFGDESIQARSGTSQTSHVTPRR